MKDIDLVLNNLIQATQKGSINWKCSRGRGGSGGTADCWATINGEEVAICKTYEPLSFKHHWYFYVNDVEIENVPKKTLENLLNLILASIEIKTEIKSKKDVERAIEKLKTLNA